MATSLLRRTGLHRPQARAGLLFALPSLVILSVFVFWPIVQALLFSMRDWSLLDQARPWIGLANYRELFADARFRNALRNTTIYSLGTVPPGIALALGLALLLNGRIRGRALLRAIFFLPVIGSFAVVAIIWTFLLDPDIGLLAYYFKAVGIPVSAWLRSTTWAMPAVILVGIWKNLGFTMVLFLAGLQGISPSLYDAAAVDGASPWAKFRYVTLPGLRHTLIFVVVIAVIGSFQVFDQVYVMTRGGPLFSTETIVTYLYYQGFELFRLGYASAIACVLFTIVFFFTLIQLRVLRYREVD